MDSPSVTVSSEAFALMKRYKDAYRSARLTVAAGKAIKVIGCVVAAILLLIGVGAASQTSAAVGFGALVVALGYGLGFFFAGMLVATQGQTLMANLDVAVNSSNLLSDAQRARVMGIDSDKATRFIVG
jgi:protein-S-isoprenylcysteine O-methyltransferase Ste14